MFPDFVRVKRVTERQLLRWLAQQVPQVTPLVRGVQRFRQHEGKLGKVVRADASEGTLDYPLAEFSLEVSREDVRSGSLDRVRAKLVDLATRIGAHQERELLRVAGEAADAVGNVVKANGELTKEHFLDVFRKIEIDFDPNTQRPVPGHVFVMHPDVARTVGPKMADWERDPAFTAEYQEIIRQKREEWRDREANRKLVS